MASVISESGVTGGTVGLYHWVHQAISINNIHSLLCIRQEELWNQKALLKSIGLFCGRAHPSPVSLLHLKSRLPKISARLEGQIGSGGLKQWLVAHHSSLFTISDDNLILLTPQGVNRFFLGTADDHSLESSAYDTQEAIGQTNSNGLASELRNAVYSELLQEAQRRRSAGELYAPPPKID